MKVILFSGKAEAGKTTAANIMSEILEEHGYRAIIIPYAAYVKYTAKLVWGWNGEKDEAGRQLLQWWGTDVVRKQYPDFWVDNVMELAKIISDQFDYLLIDDCRFPNEIESWRSRAYADTIRAISIRIDRPGYKNHLTPAQRKHLSEISLDNYKFDLYISATNKEELERSIESRMEYIYGL